MSAVTKETLALDNALDLAGFYDGTKDRDTIGAVERAVAELGEQGYAIVPVFNPSLTERERVIQTLVGVCDFFPGDVEDCADAVMELLAQAWEDGGGANEGSHHGYGMEPNPYEAVKS